jgi:hypothetical protein
MGNGEASGGHRHKEVIRMAEQGDGNKTKAQEYAEERKKENNAKREVFLEHTKETKGANRWDTDDDGAVTSIYLRKPYFRDVEKIKITIEAVD